MQKLKKRQLSKVYVQMKLSVINSEKIVEFVPEISEYANTQNKVNVTDFFANHPFHTNIENLAERLNTQQKKILTAEKWFMNVLEVHTKTRLLTLKIVKSI